MDLLANMEVGYDIVKAQQCGRPKKKALTLANQGFHIVVPER